MRKRKFKAGDCVKINQGTFEGLYANVVGYSIEWELSPIIEFYDDYDEEDLRLLCIPSERFLDLAVNKIPSLKDGI